MRRLLPLVTRYRLRQYGWLAVSGIVVAACSQPGIQTGTPKTVATHNETPVASNFQTTNQYKLQAGQHWLAIADDTGHWIIEAMARTGVCRAGSKRCSALHVETPSPLTGFSRAFHNQLVTTLVNQKAAVSRIADTDLIVDIDVQPVLFTANRPQYRYAGEPVELAPGIWAIRDVTTTTPPNEGIVPSPPDALHWFRSQFAAGQTPRAEVLVTTSITNRDRYVARTTAAYYIADTDLALYDHELCELFALCAQETEKKDSVSTVPIIGDCPIDQPCPPAKPTTASPPTATTPKPVTKPATKPVKKK